jgi:hypothetical protein
MTECWDPLRHPNLVLIEERNISFESVIFSLQSGGLLDDMFHLNKDKYPQQRIFAVSIGEYVYLVPHIETEEEIFLKTIIPSRKAEKQYLGDKR